MYVAVIPNRGSPPAILLRESYREAGKTKNRTLANLSRWPAERIEQLRAVLRGDQLLPAAEAVEIVRALPHGHVLAALGTARRIALDAVLPRRAPQRRRDLALALIVARLLEPAAKLATARMLDSATACHSLGEMLGLGKVAAKEVYATLDWLGREQPFIEAQLARRHLKDGALRLYDVTSTYLEGRCCELAQHGYSRDHRGDRPQIVIGLMCAADGCPVAVEVFEGNTADPVTLSVQIEKLKQRFKLQRVVMVGRSRHADQRAHRADTAPGWSGLDHRAAGSRNQTAGGRRRAATTLAVRSPRHGRDHQPRLSGRTPGGLQEPVARRRAGPQTCRAIGGNREGAGARRGPRAAGAQSAARCRGDRPGGRRGAATAPHGQAFPDQHHRRYVQLRPNPPQHRRRGRARRYLCDPHQSASHAVRRPHGSSPWADGPRDRARLQKSRRRRARLPLSEDRRSRAASGVSLDRATGPRARLALHAGLLSAMAHAPEPRPDAVRRARSGGARGAAPLTGGQGGALTGGATQGRPQTHRASRWRTAPGAQLPHAAWRSRHAYP